MIYTDFKGMQLPLLGFGTMRMPTRGDGSIDEKHVAQMVRAAMDSGVNYFDTAVPYHDGLAEVSIGKILRDYPRDSWYLADKFPGHQIMSSYDPAEIFEEQLRKCGVEYFDFYLLHNVYEKSIQTYMDPKWGILDYFREQKRLGRIKHLGFSTHGRLDNLREVLDLIGDDMEFCQIQLNWLDWTLQEAAEKVRLLIERGIPVWVMEPLRGGKLCQLDEASAAKLKALRPEESIPGWGFRFLQTVKGVQMVLSGMSNLQQMQENAASFAERKKLNQQEIDTLLEIAETLKDSVPCTACRYCTPHCPMGLDIPMLLATYNELRVEKALNIGMRMEALPQNKQPTACIRCGRCSRMCPQHINIPKELKGLADKMSEMPKWADVCRQREEIKARQKAEAAK
ncbi:MAG: aldo/keto reductase [Clostridia bacterium]|nr:aldo/keto reductase [Clostridia bacterium]